MQLARHIRELAKVRAERDEALAERDAARQVVAEQADKLRVAEDDVIHLTAQLNALADVTELRDSAVTYLLHAEPDMDRVG
jgi:hypothetical protein